MYPMVRCPSCNNSLGEFHEMFQTLKNHKYEEVLSKLEIKPSQVEISNMVELNTEDIFKFLNIDRWCCRKVLLTVSVFDDLIMLNPNLH